ncbi:MAG: putative DNA-binding domain-containing protein [Rhodocyclaceae bacterium]|nr:putative DNA-binding domain-containing protein [Rhodocyclaceae bacterium]
MPEALADLQQRFGAALLDPDAPTAGLFRGPSQHTAHCIALYRGNLAANWGKALGNACPVLRTLVGEDCFAALARQYGRCHAHDEGDLNTLGGGFASFVANFEALAPYPYLGDVARLEWALHRSHYALDAPRLDASQLAAIDPARIETLQLRLHPATTLLTSPWAIDDIWFAHQPAADRSLPADPRRTSRMVVLRPAWRATVRSLAAGEYAALDALSCGAPLGEALEQGFDTDPRFDPATAIPGWLAEGLFAAPNLSQEN